MPVRNWVGFSRLILLPRCTDTVTVPDVEIVHDIDAQSSIMTLQGWNDIC
jgi:hypothetical protein